MPYSLDDLIVDIKDIILNEKIPNGSDKICYFVSKALMDQNFISENLPDRQNGEQPRQILYEDKETGFCVCGHVYSTEAIGSPHDHGLSWAIYGQASGETEMTDWEIIKEKSVDDILSKYVVNELSFQDAKSKIMKLDNLNLVNIDEENIDEVLIYEKEDYWKKANKEGKSQ